MPTKNTQFQTLLNHLKLLPPPSDRIEAYNYVRDIAYGDIGSRDPFDVLSNQKGTCSGKHALLKMILESLGYEVKSYFAKHDFKNFPISHWPKELDIYRTKTLTDYHDFLKIKLENDWITLDSMFDKFLRTSGFPVQDWDGTSSLRVLVKSEEELQAEPNMEEHKKRLISELPAQVQRDRKEFLAVLTNWIDSIRKTPGR